MGFLEEIKQYSAKVRANIDAMNNAVYPEKNFVDIFVGNPKVLAEHLLHKNCISGTLTIPVRNYEQQGASGYTATIPFYLGGDMTFGFGNNWEDMLKLDVLDTLSSFINRTNGVLGQVSNVTMQSEAMSAQVWKGSTFEGFNLDCLFVCTNRQFNTLKILNILAATCLPTKWAQQPDAGGIAVKGAHNLTTRAIDTVTGWIGNLGEKFNISGAKESVNGFATSAKNYVNDMGMIAPLNYGLSQGEDNSNLEKPLPHTTVTLQIGNYFRADELLVTNLSGVTMSKEIIGPPNYLHRRAGDLYDNTPQGTDWGFPLYVKCNIKLKPHSMMHFSKWQNYFLRSQDRHDYPNLTLKSTSDYLDGGNS